MKSSAALVFTLLACLCAAQTDCKKVIVPNYQAPRVAPGWQAQVVASGLKKPRSIEFDREGGLLVVDAGAGVFRLVFEDHGGTCLEEKERVLLVNNTAVSCKIHRHMGLQLIKPIYLTLTGCSEK